MTTLIETTRYIIRHEEDIEVFTLKRIGGTHVLLITEASAIRFAEILRQYSRSAQLTDQAVHEFYSWAAEKAGAPPVRLN